MNQIRRMENQNGLRNNISERYKFSSFREDLLLVSFSFLHFPDDEYLFFEKIPYLLSLLVICLRNAVTSKSRVSCTYDEKIIRLF